MDPRQRLKSPTNMMWAPRPGWAAVRLVGTCADRSLRRGEIVLHNPSEEYDVPGQDDGLPSGTLVIVLAQLPQLQGRSIGSSGKRALDGRAYCGSAQNQ